MSVSNPEGTPAPSTTDSAEYARIAIGAVSFVLSPIMLTLLFSSTAQLQYASVTGVPLGSPGGQLGMLVGAILIVVLAHTTRWTTVGIFIATAWSAVFAIAVTLQSVLGFAPLNLLESLLYWQQLPLQTFVILLTAFIATRTIRRRVRKCKMPKGMTNKSVELSAFGTIAVLLALTLAFLVLVLAPSTVTTLLMRLPELTRIPGGREWFAILMSCVALAFLTWISTRSIAAVQLAAWLVLLIPGMFLVPLISTLTGVVATPQDPQMLAISYAMPVVGVLGLLIVCNSYSIILMQRETPSSLDEIKAVPEDEADPAGQAHAEEAGETDCQTPADAESDAHTTSQTADHTASRTTSQTAGQAEAK